MNWWLVFEVSSDFSLVCNGCVSVVSVVWVCVVVYNC